MRAAPATADDTAAPLRRFPTGNCGWGEAGWKVVGMSICATFERYGEAWAARDVDAIMTMHGEETAFHLHDGRPRAEGRAAVRAAFEAVFAGFPDLSAKEVRTVFAGDLVVFEYLATATPAGTTVPLTFEVADIIEFRNGVVLRKETYLDTAALVGHTPAV